MGERMKTLSGAIVAAVLALSAPSCAQPAPPTGVERSICRPTFQVDGQALEAGTAFLLDVGGPSRRTLLVSAYHLFGPNGGLPAQVPWDELHERATGVTCVPLTGGDAWHGGRAVTISDAHPLFPLPLRDIAAFEMGAAPSTKTLPRLKLANAAPKRGDSVWLVAQVVEGAAPTQLTHHGVVTYAGADALQYKLDNASLSIRATSGAPVVDAAGDVVGINLAGGLKNGSFLALADSLAALRSALAPAR